MHRIKGAASFNEAAPFTYGRINRHYSEFSKQTEVKKVIRLMKKEEINELAALWLNSSLTAHDFVPAEFWQEKLPLVQKEYLPGSITYVYEKEGKALGFLSLVKENKIGGLFVDSTAQNKGVGYALIEQAKRLFNFLELDVYARNEKAVHFYLRQGFQAVMVFKGEDTGEESIKMRWIQ